MSSLGTVNNFLSSAKSKVSSYMTDANIGIAATSLLNGMCVEVLRNDYDHGEYSLLRTGMATLCTLGLTFVLAREGLKKIKKMTNPEIGAAEDLSIHTEGKNIQGQVLILKCSESVDYNGAFQNMDRLLEPIQKRFKCTYLTPSTLEDIPNMMRKFEVPINHLIILGHGLDASMTLGKNCQLTIKNLTRDIFPNLAPDAHILLESCFTGVAGGLAERISSLFPQASVYGPAAPSSNITSAIFLDQEENPILLQSTSDFASPEIVTRKYCNGHFQPFPDVEWLDKRDIQNIPSDLAYYKHPLFEKAITNHYQSLGPTNDNAYRYLVKKYTQENNPTELQKLVKARLDWATKAAQEAPKLQTELDSLNAELKKRKQKCVLL